MTHSLRAALLLFSAAALFASSSGTIRAQNDIPWLWVGEIQFKDTRTVDGGPAGSASHELTAQLQLREAGRIPVITHTGGRSRQTGEFVRLVDGGSRGARVRHQGSWVWDQGTKSNKYFFSGTSQPPISLAHGWIYYSLEDDDPVRAELPHGAYSLWLNATSTNLQVKHDWVNVTNNGTFSGSRTSDVPDFPLSFWSGGPLFWREDVPGAQIPDSLNSSTVLLIATNMRASNDFPGYEERAFAVRDDGMMADVLFDRPLAAPQQGFQSARWQLRRTRDIRATLTRVDQSWRPRRHEPVAVTARLDPSLGLQGRFRFTLLDVSNHPGYATNMGGNDTTPDMKFADGQAGFERATQQGDELVILTSASDLTEAVVRIEPLDYGASAKLRAEVQIDGVWHECLTEARENVIQLPWDLDGNSIADGYDTLWGTSGQPAAADEDAHPAGAGPGDGFSNFDEYRGFEVMGVWEPTIPGIKDLFIRDELGEGAGHFAITGLRLHFIQDSEFAASRLLNPYPTIHSAGPQHALRLQYGDAENPGELGRATQGVPSEVVVLYVDTFSHYALDDAIEDATLRDSITHELGHAVDVAHHGDWERGTCGGDGMVAPWRGAHAGDVSCVMRYDGADFYQDRSGACYRWSWPLLPGTSFCSSNVGTDINAGPPRLSPDGGPMPVSGNAWRGNCRSQIRLVRR